jgi:hypothetical protein
MTQMRGSKLNQLIPHWFWVDCADVDLVFAATTVSVESSPVIPPLTPVFAKRVFASSMVKEERSSIVSRVDMENRKRIITYLRYRK